MIIMLSYDLNGHERPSSYVAVAEMIEKNATSSIKAMYSQWFIETGDPISTWVARMTGVVDKNDNWFIDLVTTSHQGWLNSSVVDWLRKHT